MAEMGNDAAISTTTELDNSGQSASVQVSKESKSIFTRIHAGYFRISISLGGQALLWKILTEPKIDSQHVCHLLCHLPSTIFHLLWWFALLAQVSVSLLYILRCFFHFHMVKAEFLHHVAVNYFYAPWISLLLLLQSAPENVLKRVSYPILCWVFSIPVLILDIKIYGQWFTTEKRFLSKFANPTSQISVIGNFLVARAAAEMGWKESAVCVFSLGLVHYMVIFITLYQRLSDSDDNHFPMVLRPAFFLFFAAPSMGSLAWNSITGAFDTSSKMFFFLSMFIFTSLACRPALLKKSMSKFNVEWWAYSIPLTFLALASVQYAQEVKGHAAPGLMLTLTSLSVLVFLGTVLLTAAYPNRLLHEDDPLMNFVMNSGSKTTAQQ